MHPFKNMSRYKKLLALLALLFLATGLYAQDDGIGKFLPLSCLNFTQRKKQRAW